LDLEGRRVLVTGAASGIGRATVDRLERGGARIAAFDVMPPTTATSTDAVRWWQVDVSLEESVTVSVSEAVAWLGGHLDVLTHVAGIMRAQQAPLGDIPVEMWDEVLQVNLRGTFLMVKHVVDHFETGTGALILVSSIAGVFMASGSFPYAASKGGMHGLAMTLEERLNARGIRVNELCPGSIHTPLLERSLSEATDRLGSTSLHDTVAARWVEPSAVAEVLAFLSTPAADILRGTIRTL